MDPQQRLLLQTAWHALEDAGYAGERFNGKVGVFVGASTSQYLLRNIITNYSVRQLDENQMIWIENDLNYLATMISYKLNLTGPSINVQSACSTSLAAVAMAYQSLLSYESDMAIAGGCRITIPQNSGYLYTQGEILSPDGDCRPFDADGNGTVVGSGVGLVALKRLSEAVKDGNQIIAVIKGGAVNNDGNAKVGFAAPSVNGEYRAIKTAHRMSEIDPETITYVETHGTATNLGDPIEIKALTEAFGEGVTRNYCALGAVKANIGHLDTASGIAGFIKTCLVLKNKQLPPNVNYKKANPNINFPETPFYVNQELTEWAPQCGVRRAAVSSFGFGGTNVHMVLEEAIDERYFDQGYSSQGYSSQGFTSQESSNDYDKSPEAELLMLSGRSKGALQRNAQSLREALRDDDGMNFRQAAMTVNYGRKQFACRSAIVFQDKAELLEGLEAAAENFAYADNKPDIVFLFPGQGIQYIGMGKDLYRKNKEFRKHMDVCAELLNQISGTDLIELLYKYEPNLENQARLTRTENTHVALFAVEYATAKTLMSYGIIPDLMIGHSIGEYVAACISEGLALEQALSLISARGKVIQKLPEGSMLSVRLSEADIKAQISGDVSLASVNAERLCVISGSEEAINRTAKELGESVPHRILHTSHAFHSHMMQAGAADFRKALQELKAGCIKIPYLSNVTGDWMQEEELPEADYWISHLTQTVRFYDCLQKIKDGKPKIFLEVGPGNTLSTFVREEFGEKSKAVSLIRPAGKESSDLVNFYRAVGYGWMHGLSVSDELFLQGRKPLLGAAPLYSFEKKRYWIEAGHMGTATEQEPQSFLIRAKAEDHEERLIPYVEPENELEEKLVEIIGSIMGIQAIGVTDHFMEIGIHSLIAGQVLTRINDMLQIEVSLSEFMNCQNIREFSEFVYTRLSEMLENVE